MHAALAAATHLVNWEARLGSGHRRRAEDCAATPSPTPGLLRPHPVYHPALSVEAGESPSRASQTWEHAAAGMVAGAAGRPAGMRASPGLHPDTPEPGPSQPPGVTGGGADSFPQRHRGPKSRTRPLAWEGERALLVADRSA